MADGRTAVSGDAEKGKEEAERLQKRVEELTASRSALQERFYYLEREKSRLLRRADVEQKQSEVDRRRAAIDKEQLDDVTEQLEKEKKRREASDEAKEDLIRTLREMEESKKAELEQKEKEHNEYLDGLRSEYSDTYNHLAEERRSAEVDAVAVRAENRRLTEAMRQLQTQMADVIEREREARSESAREKARAKKLEDELKMEKETSERNADRVRRSEAKVVEWERRWHLKVEEEREREEPSTSSTSHSRKRRASSSPPPPQRRSCSRSPRQEPKNERRARDDRKDEKEKKKEEEKKVKKEEEKDEKKEKKDEKKDVKTPKEEREEGSLECLECEYRTNSAGGFINHLRNVHSTTLVLSSLQLLCECGHKSQSDGHSRKCKFSNSTVIRNGDGPIRRLYDEKTTPQCVLCDAHPSSISAYIRHLKEHHNTTLIDHGILLKCAACGFEGKCETGVVHDHYKRCACVDFTLEPRRCS